MSPRVEVIELQQLLGAVGRSSGILWEESCFGLSLLSCSISMRKQRLRYVRLKLCATPRETFRLGKSAPAERQRQLPARALTEPAHAQAEQAERA